MSDETVFSATGAPSTPPAVQPSPVVVADDGYLPPPPGSPIGKILKIVFGLLLLVVVVFGLFVFISSKLKGNTSEKVTLVYWGLWEDKAVMSSILDDFQRQNPTITVEYIKQDSKDYRQRLLTRIQNGTGPDVFRFHNTWVPMLSQVLLPLPESVITNDEFKKAFYPVAQNDLIRNGAIYGIPLQIDTMAMYVNTDILQASGQVVPTNWNDFINTAAHVTVKDANNKITRSGTALGTFYNVTHAPDIISLLLAQNGVNFNSFSTTKANAVDALSFYTCFAKDSEKCQKVWDDTLDPSVLSFAKGNLAMHFGYSWDIFTIKAASPDLKFEVHPVPQLPGQNITIASYWVEGQSVKSTHQKEANLLMKYLSEKETEQKLYAQIAKTRLFGELYARRDLADSLKNNPLVYPFVSQAEGAVSAYFADNTDDTNGINDQMNGYLGNAVGSINTGASAESAVDTLSQGVDTVLQQYTAK